MMTVSARSLSVLVHAALSAACGVAGGGVIGDMPVDANAASDGGSSGQDGGPTPDGSVAVDGGRSDARVRQVDAGDSPDSGRSRADAASPAGGDPLRGYWVWERRVEGEVEQMGEVDRGQMKIAFGTGNDRCHYIWNEITGSDFHTECTYDVLGDLVTLTAPADPDGTAAGYSCAHPDWVSWNDRPAVQFSRYKFVGDRLWMGVNTYWGFGGRVRDVRGNNSLKRFPFWESQSQAERLESWIVFKPVTRAEWFTTYAISTRCQGNAMVCAQWPGCGAGDKPYVD